MKSSSSADRLIHGIYATVLDDTPWEELFPQLIQGFSGYAGNLFTPFVRDRSQGGLDLAHGFPHEAVQRYLTEGADVDVWYFELLRRHGVDGVLPTGLAYNSRSLLPTSQLHRSRFFADYLQPFDIGDSLGAIVGNGSRETLPVAALCVFRDLAAKPFEDQDLAKLQRPQRHFTSALELRMRMCRTMVDAVSRTFDLLTDAVAVMALDATVLLTNAAADRLLAKRQYPQVRFGR